MSTESERPAGAESPETLLSAFLCAPEHGAEALLGRLLVEHAGPVVDRVLRANLRAEPDGAGGGHGGLSAADLRAESLARLLAKLRALRADPGARVIDDFRGYAAAVARNTLSEHLRRRDPARERLRRRLWHLLADDPRFGLWRGAGGGWLCGLAEPPAAAPAPGGAAILPRLGPAVPRPPAGNGPGRAELAARLHSVLAGAGRPVAFGDLLSTLAERGARSSPVPAPLRSIEELADPRPDTATALVGRATLAAVWQEVAGLSLRQRTALLLGLRDERGRSALLLLPVTGTASIRRIATVLEWSPERLAMVWNRLPLDDRGIAELLGVSRQQVINLRKAARARLARRLAKRGLAP